VLIFTSCGLQTKNKKEEMEKWDNLENFKNHFQRLKYFFDSLKILSKHLGNFRDKFEVQKAAFPVCSIREFGQSLL